MVCRKLIFSGRVQGVGFRLTVYRMAQDVPVIGFVRNLNDGRVELWVQGEAAVVDEFVAAIKGAFTSNIERIEIGAESLQDFQSFQIRA